MDFIALIILTHDDDKNTFLKYFLKLSSSYTTPTHTHLIIIASNEIFKKKKKNKKKAKNILE